MEVFHHCCWLGHGSYGDVQLCEVSPRTMEMLLGAEYRQVEHVPGPILIALKTWKQAHKEGKVMQIALREVQLLKAVSHPNIIKLQSAFRTPSGRVCMVFEYGGKSTHQLLETRFPRGFSQPLLRRLTFQIVQALCYLHSRKIIHRDVKPANILVDSEGVLRLCDFGFARYLSGSANSEAVLLSATRNNNGDGSDGGDDSGLWTPYVITRWYRAPEVLLGMPYGTPTDVWSLGCTLAELATGEPLFPGTSSLDQIGRIAALLGPLPNHMAARVTGKPRSGVALPADGKVAVSAAEALRQRLRPQQGAEFLELLTACLRTDPRDRPTVEQLLRMPYLADAAKLFEGSSLGHAYIAAPLTGPVQAARKLAPPSQPFPAPQPPSTDGMQSAKTELMPVPPGHCRFHRCHPHPPPHQQHIHHHQQHQQTYHGNYQQQRCSIYPQKQQQQDSRSRDVFRCSRGLQHSASMGSSVDAGSTITSASCSVMSITPVMRSVTSVTDSSFSTVPLGSSTCCYHCSGGAAGVASDTVCTCHAEASNFVPGSASNAQPLLSPAAAAAAAVETSSCQVDNGINRGSSISACIAGKAAPEQLEGLQCARKAAADHPPVGGISVGSGDGMQDGITGACLRSTAVASSLVRGLKSHDSTAPMASSLSELLDVTVTLPSSLCVPAAEAGPSAPAVHLDSRPAPPHPSDFSREAAIRAMTAAAAFASDGSAAEGTLATAMTSCHSVAGVQSALPVYRDHHYQHQQQCFDSSSGRSSSSSDSEQVCAPRPGPTKPGFAVAGAAAIAAATSSFDAAGVEVPGSHQAWRDSVSDAIMCDEDGYDNAFGDGGDNGNCGGYSGGGGGGGDHPVQGLSTHWLDSYYHNCSPVAISAAAMVAAGLKAMATSAGCAASTHTTLSFNWHNAESPCSGAAGSTEENQSLRHTTAPGSDAWPVPRPPPKQQEFVQALKQQPLAVQLQPRQPLKARPEQQLRRRWRLCRYVAAPAAGGAVVGASNGQAQPPLPPLPLKQGGQEQGHSGPEAAGLSLMSAGLCPRGAYAIAAAHCHEDSRLRRVRGRASRAHSPTADGSCADGDCDYGSSDRPGGSNFSSDSEGCRPRAITLHLARRRYASAPGATAPTTAAFDANTRASVPCLVGKGARTTEAEAATAGLRPRPNGLVASGLACGPVWPTCDLPRDSEGGTCEESMGMRRCDDGGFSGARSAAAPSAAIAAAAAAPGPSGGVAPVKVAARSVTAATECINSAAFSLDSTAGARSCCTSIGERGPVTVAAEAGNTASATTCRGVTSRGSKGGHRFKWWLRKGRIWLRHLFQSSFPTRQFQPR